MSLFRYPVVHGCGTYGLIDSQLAADFDLHPQRYRKVCFTPVGPIFQVIGRSSRTLRLRQHFADGSYSDSSYRITGTSEVLVLNDSFVFYNPTK